MSNRFANVLKTAGTKAAAAEPCITKRPSGRPRAKHSDPEYGQITAYIRRTTHAEAKLKLLREKLKNQGQGRDFSELVQDLVAEWVRG